MERKIRGGTVIWIGRGVGRGDGVRMRRWVGRGRGRGEGE